MLTVKSAIAQAASNARNVIDRTDRKFLSLPLPPDTSKAATAGELLVAVAKAEPGANPHTAVKTARVELAKELAEAKGPLVRAEGFASHLRSVAHFLKDGTPLPPEVPIDLVAHARMVKAGARAGVSDPLALAEILFEAADEAEDMLERAHKGFRKYGSTLTTAAMNQTVKYLRRCGPDYDYAAEGMAKRAGRHAALHRKIYGKD